jgi:hypothetical protein
VSTDPSIDQRTHRPTDTWGVCADCRRPVTFAERDTLTRCCPGGFDYSWNAVANPHNVEWEPGYRFFVHQDSQRTGRVGNHMKRRVYNVGIEIDRAGRLRPCTTVGGGVKPTEKTMSGIQARYEKERPHLPLSREQLQHLVDAWEHANDPTSAAIAEKARALLAEADVG